MKLRVQDLGQREGTGTQAQSNKQSLCVSNIPRRLIEQHGPLNGPDQARMKRHVLKTPTESHVLNL